MLSGVTWLLTQHPDKLQNLAHEVRSRFKSLEAEAMKMPYLIAVANG